MKNINAVALALCLVLGTGNVFAQDNAMTKDAMGHDKTHDGMKSSAMAHDTMKMDTMSKGSMSKGAMSKGSKSSGMMKKDKASQDSMGDASSQH